MNESSPAYGLWSLVVIDSLVFIIFAYSFTKPKTARDWRSFGAFSAFIAALFAEMYGFPLTIYLLSGWLQAHYPGMNIYSHNAGHLWHDLLGLKGNAHTDPLHIVSIVFIGGGFWAARIRMARALPGAARTPFGDHWDLCQDAPSAVCGFHAHHVRLPVAMAHPPDAADVSGAGVDVCQAGKAGGTGCRKGFWRRVRSLCRTNPRIPAAHGGQGVQPT